MHNHTAIPDKLVTFLDKYFAHLKYEKNLSEASIKSYQRQLYAICETLNIETWSKLTTDHVRQILTLSRKANLSPRSIALRLSSVRGFCDYLVMHKVLSSNPATPIQAPKQSRPLPKQLNVDDEYSAAALALE